MPKPIVTESRFDWRRGRNTAISPDLLNDDELVDLTNGRLTEKYGAFTKRAGCQRIHQSAFSAPIRGVTQWDGPSGKQVVVIGNGSLWWRNGTNFAAAFTEASTAGVARTTTNQGSSAGWTDPDGTNDGKNSVNRTTNGITTIADGSKMILKFGDPAIDGNLPAADDVYTLKFRLQSDASGVTGTDGSFNARIQLEYSTNDGGAWTDLPTIYTVQAGVGENKTQEFEVMISVDIPASKLWIRLELSLQSTYLGSSGTSIANVFCFSTVYLTNNYPGTWTSGAARFSLTEPSIFAPFRASAAGLPLVLYIASGGHYFSWDGVSTLTQLDPTNSAPLTTSIIPFHTRMFAMSASTTTPGLLPKTIFWSKIGDATNFNTGDKTFGGAAVTDFLTGQQLTALEVIGSSLLMATQDSIMRFQGHASDEIVISQDTEGISAEVGVVGLLALKRFENVAAFLSARGPYAATETSAIPIGEQVLPDFDALDSANLSKSVVQYNRGRKDLWFAVPGASDGGLNKTVFAQAVRLQAWQGPWLYSFGINVMANYVGASGIENVIAGCSDGFVRLMDVGTKDDVLYDGTGGTNITITGEIPTMQHGRPGVTKALIGMMLQATLPTGSALKIKHSYDGAAFIEESVVSEGSTELNYRVDMDNQGKRLRIQFVDASAVAPIINGFILEAYDYDRA